MSEGSKASSASTMPPVPLDQMLVVINRYIKSSAVFLQDFALQCDSKLSAIRERTDELETQVRLLESKFDGMTLPSVPSSSSATKLSEPALIPIRPNEFGTASDTGPRHSPRERASEPKPNILLPIASLNLSAPDASPHTAITTAADGRLIKYVNMLKVGIPREAVIIKMGVDGVQDLASMLPS